MLTTVASAIGALTLAIWLYLSLGRAMFWRIDREAIPAEPKSWPQVVAVIPARNEADGIASTLNSLWRQDYPHALHVVLVDDGSTDGTAEVARKAACEAGLGSRLTLISGEPLPAGWSGKVWAMHQGVTHGLAPDDRVNYVL